MIHCHFSDLSWNKIASFGTSPTPFIDLNLVRDLKLNHNNLTKIDDKVFQGLFKLQTLDMSNNEIDDIHEDAFAQCEQMRDM